MAHTHDNELKFYVNGITNMSFTEESHFITDGQPYDGTTMHEVSNGVADVVIVAGRKGSHEVADNYNRETGFAHSVASKVSLDLQPDELNFAVKGKLQITSTNSKVYQSEVLFAQGHNSHNNWWIGGKSIYGYPGSFFGTSQGLAIMSLSEDEIKKQIQALFDYVYDGVYKLINNTEEFLEEALNRVKAFIEALKDKVIKWSEYAYNNAILEKVLTSITAFLDKIVDDINKKVDSLENFAENIESIIKQAFDKFYSTPQNSTGC